MAVKRKKAVLFIVEGPSDKSALEAILSKLLGAENVFVEVTYGDFTSDDRISEQSIKKEIGNFVRKNATSYSLKSSDFAEVILIVDMDGAFVPDSVIITKPDVEKALYYDDHIEIADILKIVKRNDTKRRKIMHLISTPHVWQSIPFSVYFFSSNLDHVLHNQANLPQNEKVSLAGDFSDKYKNDIAGFLRYINDETIAIKTTYDQSWEYIQTGSNSLIRCTNFNIYLSQNAKNIPRDFSSPHE